ncbi:hypothetical protein ACFQZZ_23055 [Nocardia sp. GCM10030253]|uniref:hypothetical protein n=1 Tax=Nocardia sp. GCM10030253 TaxID=3273404 RepID=UPI003632CD7E
MAIHHDTVVNEIHAMHADLARWIGAPDEHEARDRFVTQLHRDCSLVVLEGAVVSLEQLLQLLDNAGNSLPGLTIDIVDLEILHRSDGCVVVRFREIHHRPDGPASRWTTALLLPDAQGRNGLRWRSVHETAAAD